MDGGLEPFAAAQAARGAANHGLVPLQHVAAHVVSAVGAGRRRKRPHRRQVVRRIRVAAIEIVGIVRAGRRQHVAGGRVALRRDRSSSVPFAGL